MTDPSLLTTVAATFAALALVSVAGLKAWHGWLAFKRLEIASHGDGHRAPSPASRIELADLKERVRKLEAIANGLDQ